MCEDDGALCGRRFAIRLAFRDTRSHPTGSAPHPPVRAVSFNPEMNAWIVFSTSCGTSALYGPLN
jgi:hypothetical protein